MFCKIYLGCSSQFEDLKTFVMMLEIVSPVLVSLDDTAKGDLAIFWEHFTVIHCAPKHISYAYLVHCNPLT